MILEPEIIIANLAATTAGAGVTTTNTPIAAPGAGMRLRIFGLKMVVTTASPAGRVENRVREGAAGLFIAYLACATAGNNGDEWSLTSGVPLTENTSLQVVDVGSVGAMIYRLSIAYKVEQT